MSEIINNGSENCNVLKKCIYEKRKGEKNTAIVSDVKYNEFQ